MDADYKCCADFPGIFHVILNIKKMKKIPFYDGENHMTKLYFPHN